MSTSRRPTYPPEPKPNVTTTGLCMYGVGAGLLGIAAYVYNTQLIVYWVISSPGSYTANYIILDLA